MILSNLKNTKIILASKSPRRQELLKGLELDFDIRVSDVDESYSDELKEHEIPCYLSKKKGDVFLKGLDQNELVISSDTLVFCDDVVLEKPKSREQAVEMLSALSENVHRVITAVTLTKVDFQTTFYDTTKVTFNRLSLEEIHHYIDKYKPFDKAGSYGVQDLIGYIGIKKLEGCYYNVMGLPLQKLYRELKKL